MPWEIIVNALRIVLTVIQIVKALSEGKREK